MTLSEVIQYRPWKKPQGLFLIVSLWSHTVVCSCCWERAGLIMATRRNNAPPIMGMNFIWLASACYFGSVCYPVLNSVFEGGCFSRATWWPRSCCSGSVPGLKRHLECWLVWSQPLLFVRKRSSIHCFQVWRKAGRDTFPPIVPRCFGPCWGNIQTVKRC